MAITCTKCLRERDESEFFPSVVKLVRERGWRGYHCRECYRSWERARSTTFSREHPDVTSRVCPRCKIDKHRDEYAPSVWAKKGSGWCRECMRGFYAEKNRTEPGYTRKFLFRRRRETTTEVQALKASTGCVRCGERHPACLDYHHLKARGSKNKTVAAMVARGWSVETIKREIAKCELLCANCHRKLHAEIGHPDKKHDAVLAPRKNPSRKKSVAG